ncbi:MAG: hypothetical protein JWN62_4438 [Acidimicrobiales bacterium]|nr:hypothetical protein [Acidimicrobiales bacterium]
MIIAGLILMLLALITGLGILWTAGIVVALIGVVLLVLGRSGHEVGGRHHYW